MARRSLYVPFVVDYFDDRALVLACAESPWCEVLFMRCNALAKAELSDGNLSPADLLLSRVPNAQRWAAVLVKVGLWTETETGWLIRSFSKHNLTAAQVAEKQAATARRVAEYRARNTSANTRSNGARNALRDALPLKGEGIREKGEEVPTELTPLPQTAGAAVAKAADRPRDLLFDALAMLAEGVPRERFASLTKTQSRAIAVAAAEIRKAGGDHTTVRAACASYQHQFPGASLTASALAKHWARCQPGTGALPSARPGNTGQAARTRQLIADGSALLERMARPPEPAEPAEPDTVHQGDVIDVSALLTLKRA